LGSSGTRMRQTVILVLLICLLPLIKALGDAEGKCTQYLDDCSACLKQKGCGWCNDGFCTVEKSGNCPSTISQEESICGAQSKIRRSPETRGTQSECFLASGADTASCSACQALNCSSCISPTVAPDVEICVQPDPYGIYSGFVDPCFAIQVGGQAGVALGFSTQTCSALALPSGTTPSHPTILTITGVTLTGTLQTPLGLQLEIVITMNQIYNYNPRLQASNVPILSFSDSKKRQTSTATASFYFQDTSAISSDQFTKDFQSAVSAGAFTGVTSGSVAVSPGASGGGGGDAGISKGALAGIIIGSVFGGMLLIMIAAFLIYKWKESSQPSPFRSPAAAYRP